MAVHELRRVAEPDPVLAALIAKLPPTGSIWPAAKRAAWLKMVHMAFDLVYDGEDGEAVELPSFLQASAPAAAAAAPEPAPPAPAMKASPFTFLIDREGYARRGDGTRINPVEVGTGVLYDERGEAGDFAAIIWADDSRGVPAGLQLDISPAF
jgi:hypothetical protein